MDTRLVRCIAVLLIANSHLSDYYPLPQLAGDGLLGNSLFFLMSGFGLAVGDTRRRRSAVQWFSRRFMKLYPSLAVVLAFTAVYDFPALRIHGASEIVWGIFWPFRYPFVRQITTFYVIYFLWSRTRAANWPVATIAALIPVYVLWREVSPDETRTHAMHWVYYFQMFLLGVALSKVRMPESQRARNIVACALPALFLAYVGTKFVLSRSGQAESQVHFLHLLAVPVLLAMMTAFTDTRLTSLVDRRPVSKRFADWLAGATYEIYLVHYLVLELDRVRAAPLPANLALFWGGTFVAAFLLQGVRDLGLKASRIGIEAVGHRIFEKYPFNSTAADTPELMQISHHS